MATCDASQILAAAIAAGYDRLSKRDLVAVCVSSLPASTLEASVASLKDSELSEYDTAECTVQALCSSPGSSNSADQILAAAQANKIDQLSRRDLDAVQVSLLCTKTNPPCSTPTAPINPTAKVITNTTILIIWNQVANTGSLITGYTVKWGTVTGVYTFSANVAAIPKSYTITGLTSGTQYFFVVQATTAIGGCVSVNSNEGNATTTGAAPCVSAIVTDWVTRALAGGGSAPSAAEQLAVCQFANGLVTDGLDALMLQWNPIASSGGVITALTPALLGSGTRNVWTNSGPFVAGDLTAAGLKGDGVGKFSDTGFIPTSFSSDNSCGITIYLTTNPNSNSCDIGVTQGGNLTSLQPFAGTTYFDSYALAGRISAANAGFKGFISGNRVAGPTTSIYEANSTTPVNTLVTANVAAGGSRPALEYYAWAMNNGGVQTSLSDHTIGFIAFHNGLSAAQAQLFYNRIQTLMTALGRAI